MRNNWRERVCVAAPHHTYYDPCKHGLTSPDEYAAWDLGAINATDWLVGYLEASNPSGYGLAVEIGFAKGRGIFTLLCNERLGERDLRFLDSTADVTVPTFDDLVRFVVALPTS